MFLKKSNIKIHFDASEHSLNKPIIQPLDNLYNEIRHIRNTIVFLNSLILKNKTNKQVLQNCWQTEIDDLEQILKKELYANFLNIYQQSLCILQEFEIEIYNRMYLEIVFLRSEWS